MQKDGGSKTTPPPKKKQGSYRKETLKEGGRSDGETSVRRGNGVEGGEGMDEWIGAQRRGRIMRITVRGVDQRSPRMDQRSQKTQPGRMSGEGGNGMKGGRKMRRAKKAKRQKVRDWDE